MSAVQLVGDRLVGDDGSGDELREESHIRAEGDDVFLWFGVAAVDVYRVGHGLKCVEGDADRERDAGEGQGGSDERVDGSREEVVVFEEPEERQIDDHRGRDDQLSRARVSGSLVVRYEQSVRVIYKSREYHEHDIDGLAPRVEYEADDEEQKVAQFFRADKVEYEHKRQVPEKK